MKVKLPTYFKIDYPKNNRAYYSGAEKSKDIIHSLLQNASNGYCMYCGVRLNVEQMDISQIEHSVDKKGNKNQKGSKSPLINCKYNLAIACPQCNMKYKKSVVKVDLRGKFLAKCPTMCSAPCFDYLSVKKTYITNNRMILQPGGVKNADVEYGIAYDVFDHLYIPTVDDDDISLFIQEHIVRFHLNSEKRSDSIIKICADIVELGKIGVNDSDKALSYVSQSVQNNVIGEMFLIYLKEHFKGKSIEDLIDLCENIVLSSAWI